MPSKCQRRLSERFARIDGADLVELINRELLPVVRDLRDAYNLAVGPAYSEEIMSDLTLSAEYQYYPVDASGGAVELTLPSASGWLMPLKVLKLNTSTPNVTVTPAGSDTILGASSYIVPDGHPASTLISDGDSNWWVF